MFAWSRTKSTAGGRFTRTELTSAATLNVPDDMNLVLLTGTASVTALNAGLSTRNRIVTFVQHGTGSTTFTNTDGATAAGTMDLGGSNVVLGQTDILVLLLRANGTWLRITNTNN
jgi:hypothetical protein